MTGSAVTGYGDQPCFGCLAAALLPVPLRAVVSRCVLLRNRARGPARNEEGGLPLLETSLFVARCGYLLYLDIRCAEPGALALRSLRRSSGRTDGPCSRTPLCGARSRLRVMADAL